MCEYVLILTQGDAQSACPELFYCINKDSHYRRTAIKSNIYLYYCSLNHKV